VKDQLMQMIEEWTMKRLEFLEELDIREELGQ
jgi:hypothetical protein